LAATLCLGGCASGVRPADDRLPAVYGAVAQAIGADADITRWWARFGDPQLDALIEEAFTASPDARAALSALREARAERAGALSGFAPQGTPYLSRSRQTADPGTGHVDATSLSWDVSWELDVLGRRSAARTAADADLAAAAFDHEASRVSLAANVAQALFQARALEVQANEAAETVRIARDLERVSALKAQRGVLSRADAASLKAELAGAQAQARQLRAQAQVQRRVLMVLVGRARDPIDSLTLDLPDLVPPMAPASAPGELLARRPDLRRAKARVTAAAGDVVSAKLAQLPTLALTPSLSAVRPQGGMTTSLWSVGATLATPILDQPRLRAQVRLRSAQAESAVLAYERAVGEAYAETENALVTLAADRDRLTDLVEAEHQARLAFEAQSQGFKAGYVDTTALLQTERVWRVQRTSLTIARGQALADAALAFKSLGGGWTPADPATLVSRTLHDR
jgi:NodT family efflux transporter outer membrane factor (OMF) lipoprotein